ncbi:TonB-dependent receptor [candidate division KSB1 bacterium]|nr:TonB-dependent receptor [candidate division KSB1 bacterium]
MKKCNRRRTVCGVTSWKAIVIALLAAQAAWAGVTVSGKIKDRETGESVPSASVQVMGTGRGAATNVEGFFSIPDLQPGSITLLISSLGYAALKKELMLEAGNDMQLDLKVVPEAVQMMEINVEAEIQNRGEREYTPQVAQYTMETKELAKLPRLAEADLFRSLQFIPGVLPTSDFSSELNIWGGSSDQNLILLNGIEVYKPTHLGGLFSTFNMDAIKDVKLIKGGFPAKYGGRLSAVVDVADREGNRNQMHGKLGISLLSSQATLEGPVPRGSWLLAGRRTYVDAATKLLSSAGVIDETSEFPYYFYDLNAKVTRDFANGDRLTPSAYLGSDVLNITSTTEDRIHLDWGNKTYSLPFVHIWNHKLFSTNTLAGSHYKSTMRFETAEEWSEFRNRVNDFTLKSDYTWFANARNTFDFGIMAKDLECLFTVLSNTTTFTDGTYHGWQYAAYLQDDFRVNHTLTLSPGLRVEHNTLSDQTEGLPRFAVKQELTPTSSISAATGIYVQPFQQITFGDNFASLFNSYVLLDKSFSPNRAYHYALTYENDWEGPWKLSAGSYFKDFARVIEWNPYYIPKESDELGDIFTVGDGQAYGADVYLQGHFDRYTILAGYGVGRADRAFPFWDEGDKYPASYDRLHNLNLFVSKKIRKRGSLEARFNYGSGNPVTRAEGIYSPGIGLPPYFFDPGDKNGYRLPAYNRLDVAYRLRYEGKRWTFSPYIEITNLYNQKNILTFAYELGPNPVKINETGQIPFLPSIGFTAEF